MLIYHSLYLSKGQKGEHANEKEAERGFDKRKVMRECFSDDHYFRMDYGQIGRAARRDRVDELA